MKILIATGIFTPEVGGPATYIPKLAEELIKLGHQLLVLTYSDDRQYGGDQTFPYQLVRIKRANKLSNYWRYYKTLKSLVKDYDVLYAFDHFSAGLPAALIAKKYQRPLFIRVGGDFIWERYLDRSRNLVTLRQFYEQGLHISAEGFRFKIIKWVFRQAQGIIFSTNFQKEIFIKYYHLDETKIYLVANPVTPAGIAKRDKVSKEIIFAGRFINKNNIKNLLAAFALCQTKDYQLTLIGAGPLENELLALTKDQRNIKIEDKLGRLDLGQRMAAAYLAVFPSLTDISPNTMLECLSLDVPFISSKEIGFDWLLSQIITFDPQSIDDLADKLKSLFNKENYDHYVQRLSQIEYSYTYDQAAVDTMKILQNKNG